jgi:hypothetical protein
MKSVLIIIDYFGTWPLWFDMFLKTCELNPTIHWLLHTDCPVPPEAPKNVRFAALSREDYERRVGAVLGVRFSPRSMYSICNLRPAFGELYAQEIRDYDYFGWGDIDVLYGNIRNFYNDHVLTHNVICSSAQTCTGHLTLLRNSAWLRQAFRAISGWRARLEDPAPHPWEECLDEAKLSGLFSPSRHLREKLRPRGASTPALSHFSRNNYFRQQWHTPFIPARWHDGRRQHPEVWYWRNGRLTNEQDGDREFLYLHLMNFKGKRWVDEELYGSAPTWERLSQVIHFDCSTLRDHTVRIDRQGIHREE